MFDSVFFPGYVAIVENSTPMLRAKTAGIAAVLQSLSGVVFVSYAVRVPGSLV